jgi:DNA-binding LytR/AlgR family response regulator
MPTVMRTEVLIIEDEPEAAKRLITLIREQLPEAKVLTTLDSVRNSVKWLEQNAPPDLIFMDIQLADGLSFQIFEQVSITSPVIFTTAYDAYALKAFKVNSIDYILKPVDRDDLANALNKLKTLTQKKDNASELLLRIGDAVKMLTRQYKSRFMIKIGEHLKSVEVSGILYFFSLEKATFAKLLDGRKHIIDFSLDQLEEMLNPELFFRINRKYIVSTPSILDMVSYSNSRLKLMLKDQEDSEIIVSRERVQQFKDWLDR